jgi:hypothetical protein
VAEGEVEPGPLEPRVALELVEGALEGGDGLLVPDRVRLIVNLPLQEREQRREETLVVFLAISWRAFSSSPAPMSSITFWRSLTSSGSTGGSMSVTASRPFVNRRWNAVDEMYPSAMGR